MITPGTCSTRKGVSFRYFLSAVLKLLLVVSNCKSVGKPFHRIIARGKKEVRVDVRLTVGTG